MKRLWIIPIVAALVGTSAWAVHESQELRRYEQQTASLERQLKIADMQIEQLTRARDLATQAALRRQQ